MYFHYQPIYRNSKIVHFEALLRLKNKNIDIESFINEQNDKVNFDLMVIDKVLNDIKKTAFNSFSINISIVSLESRLFVDKCILLLNESCKQIILEVTEHDKCNDFNIVKENITKIKNNTKCKFALDDFGKGYSNTEALMSLPFDIVKIDKIITAKISENFIGFLILKNMIYKIRDILNKSIVIEGIEDSTTVKLINSIGKDLNYQGFYFSRPATLDSFIDYMLSDNENKTSIKEKSMTIKLEELIYKLIINDNYKINHNDFHNIFLFDRDKKQIIEKASSLLERMSSIQMLFMSSLMYTSNCALIVRDIHGCAIYNNDNHITSIKKDLVGIQPSEIIKSHEYYKNCLDLDHALICSNENFSYNIEEIKEFNMTFHTFRQKIMSNGNVYIICSIYTVG